MRQPSPLSIKSIMEFMEVEISDFKRMLVLSRRHRNVFDSMLGNSLIEMRVRRRQEKAYHAARSVASGYEWLWHKRHRTKASIITG